MNVDFSIKWVFHFFPYVVIHLFSKLAPYPKIHLYSYSKLVFIWANTIMLTLKKMLCPVSPLEWPWVDSRNFQIDALSVIDCIFLKTYIGPSLRPMLRMKPDTSLTHSYWSFLRMWWEGKREEEKLCSRYFLLVTS